jgi:hypothetical protein
VITRFHGAGCAAAVAAVGIVIVACFRAGFDSVAAFRRAGTGRSVAAETVLGDASVAATVAGGFVLIIALFAAIKRAIAASERDAGARFAGTHISVFLCANGAATVAVAGVIVIALFAAIQETVTARGGDARTGRTGAMKIGFHAACGIASVPVISIAVIASFRGVRHAVSANGIQTAVKTSVFVYIVAVVALLGTFHLRVTAYRAADAWLPDAAESVLRVADRVATVAGSRVSVIAGLRSFHNGIAACFLAVRFLNILQLYDNMSARQYGNRRTRKNQQ